MEVDRHGEIMRLGINIHETVWTGSHSIKHLLSLTRTLVGNLKTRVYAGGALLRVICGDGL